MAKYKIAGFLFETEEEAQKAKKELDAVRYIQSQIKKNDPDMMFRLYDRLVRQNYFETPVGIEFLREMQTKLETVPQIRREDILPIPIPNQTLEAEKDEKRTKMEEREKRAEEKQWLKEKKSAGEQRYKKLFIATGILSVMLAAIVIGMFVITYMSGNDMTIFNYEQQVIDKYEAWEQELDQREADLTEREKALEE